MRERKPRNNEVQNPAQILRRSPRFFHGNQTNAENPATSKPSTRKIRVPDFFSTPVGCAVTQTQNKGDVISRKEEINDTVSKYSTKCSKGSRRSTRSDRGASVETPHLQKQYVIEKRVTRSSVREMNFSNSHDDGCAEISRKKNRNATLVDRSAKSGKGSRRSGRLDGEDRVSKAADIQDSPKQHVIEKRVTRSAVRADECVSNLVSEFDSEEGVRVSSKQGNAKVVVDKRCVGNVETRFTRSSNKTGVIPLVKNAGSDATDSQHKMAVLNETKPTADSELPKPCPSEGDVEECGVDGGRGDTNCKRKTLIDEKRKRCEVEEKRENVEGWSEEQELALQRAYFSAKPTPHFWKKVAKMVPGKSAEECFNRIHSDHLTPSQPQMRSRANRNKLSALSFSASKLLVPAEMKTQKCRSGRRKTLMAQKTVRQLLESQHKEDQNYEADFFAVLEPTIDPYSLNFHEGTEFASPAPNQGSGFLARSREMSSLANKKHQSRLHSSKKAAFVSPPVLKQIKNKALHEKYIDQLHRRNAKRNAESLRNAKCIQKKDDQKGGPLKVKSIKVAKDALVFDARDAINQFRCFHSSTNDDIDDDDDDDDDAGCTDQDEDERLC